MNYPGDKSRYYNDGDVDSYLRNDQPINISYDAPAPEALSLSYQQPCSPSGRPNLLLSIKM